MSKELKELKDNNERISAIFRSVLTRNPKKDDIEVASQVMNNSYTQFKAVRMILWALINTREFMYIQ